MISSTWLPHGLEADAQGLERLGRDPLALVDQAQEDVLGADVVVVEEPSFLLGEHDHTASPVGEPFEQGTCLPPNRGICGGECTASVRAPRRRRPFVTGHLRGVSAWCLAGHSCDLSWPDGRPQPAARRARHGDRPGARRGPAGRRRAHRRRRRSPRWRRTSSWPAASASAPCSPWPRPRPRPPTSAGGQLDDAVTGGVAVELVHIGSLYHDDVIDEAATRRTVDSVNARWGNLRAILAGDFLLARASELAASLGTEVAGLLAATIGRLCEGEVRELQPRLPGRPQRGRLPGRDRRQDGVAVRHRLPHRRHRRRPAPRR